MCACIQSGHFSYKYIGPADQTSPIRDAGLSSLTGQSLTRMCGRVWPVRLYMQDKDHSLILKHHGRVLRPMHSSKMAGHSQEDTHFALRSEDGSR